MSPSPAMSTSTAYKRAVVLLLMTAYTFNAMDRNIIAVVSQSIKVDLRLTDAELGLLGGTAFALFYAFGGIPIARLAERFNRVRIIAVAMMVWSALCAMCGAAPAYPQLLLTRVGVGIAESGCSPPAHSLISDYFPSSERTSALSLYSCGSSVGYLLAAWAGGFVAERWGWRAACACVGLPGILIGLITWLVIRDPREQRPRRPAPAPAAFSLRREAGELLDVARLLARVAPVRHMILGLTIGGFAAYGFYGFVPAFYTRAFGLSYGHAGTLAGIAGGPVAGVGIALGGRFADALARRHARWYALLPGIGALVSVPLFMVGVLAEDWRLSVAFLSLAGFSFYLSLGPTFGVIQNVVAERQRATATAFLYICLSVIALGGGPLFTGWVMDRFAAADFRAAGYSEPFKTSCPGGRAPAAAEPGRVADCGAALRRSTRQGMMVALIFFAWGGGHYVWASRGMAGALREGAKRGARSRDGREEG